MSQLQPSQAGDDDDVNDPNAAVPAGDVNLNIEVARENKNRRVHLITYSQVDRNLFPTRESFCNVVVEAFGGMELIEYAAVCEEPHQHGGVHYHMSMKLVGTSRWRVQKRRIMDAGAVVHFSQPKDETEGMYAWAYRYVIKYDLDVYHTPGHPSLERIEGNPRAARANEIYRRNAAERRRGNGEGHDAPDGGQRKRKYNCEDVGEYCIRKDIHSITELMADAEIRKGDGDSTLSSFIYRTSLKKISELIDKAWMMQKSVSKLQSLRTPRMERLRQVLEEPCLPGCDELWFRCAVDVLQRNNINQNEYASALCNLLQNGRGKDRNLLLVGPTGSAKSFLLMPLHNVFPETFANPAASSFSWIGADECSIIFLNDYRWNTKRFEGNIEWGTFLRLLEGATCDLPAPMNTHTKHIKIKTDVPIFVTSPRMFQWYAMDPQEPRTEIYDKEDEHIKKRYKLFQFSHTIPMNEKFTIFLNAQDVLLSWRW
jgi:hypothetical protein